MTQPIKNVRRIAKNARSPYDAYCEGFGNNDSSGCYITTPIVAAGKTALQGAADRSLVLEQIQAFDTAEAEGAYIGQINLYQISSFCGLNGAIWGHDMAKCPRRPLYSPPRGNERRGMPIYDIEELSLGTKRLFGTARQRRFPIIPGSLVPAAYKTISDIGPVTLYGGLAIGIPKNQSTSAALFMEYIGKVQGISGDDLISAEMKRIRNELIVSTRQVGANHDIRFEMIYVGARALNVESDRLGCVLVAAPYVTLAKNVLNQRLLDNIEDASIDDWEAETAHSFHRETAS